MIEARRASRFADESPQRLAVCRYVRPEHLQCRAAVQRRIKRPVHRAHAALAEKRLDPVMADGGADQRVNAVILSRSKSEVARYRRFLR
jgi:hypothetical protein